MLLREPKAHPSFEIRNLASNGNVWTGVGTVTCGIFPPIERLAKDDYPIENKLSIAFRVSYGSFDYFAGHVVIRVDPGVASYHVFVLDDSNGESRLRGVRIELKLLHGTSEVVGRISRGIDFERGAHDTPSRYQLWQIELQKVSEYFPTDVCRSVRVLRLRYEAFLLARCVLAGFSHFFD